MAISSAFFMLMMMSHQCLSVAMTRFTSSKPENVDVLDLYYEFLASNSSQINRTETVFGIKSLVQCSVLCLVNTNFKCVAFAYESKEGSCHMFSILITENRIFNKTFRRIPDCPVDFVYLEYYNKCYRLMRGRYNWSDGRMKCNAINSHLVIVDDYKEYEALSYFFSTPNGVNPTCVRFTWLPGNKIAPNQRQFVWKPYQMKDGREPYLPINFYNWRPGQPNYAPNEDCLLISGGYHDYVCNYSSCAVCEIDV